ncbi:hypothetical protein N9N28_15735 [Rubripirellula amarantea]|nr:hypothetical protein [Rubripirellula amarantea]
MFNQLSSEKRATLLPIARSYVAKRQDSKGYFGTPNNDWTSRLSGSYKIAAFLDGTGSPIPRKKDMRETTLHHLFNSDYRSTIVLYNTANMLNIVGRNGENFDLDMRIQIVRRFTNLLKKMHGPDGGFVTQIGKASPTQNGIRLADDVIESNTNATGLAHKARNLIVQLATGKEEPYPHANSVEFLNALPQ